MKQLSYESERQAKENLKKAFNEIKRSYSSDGNNHAELAFQGLSSLSREINQYKYEIQDLIKFIEIENQKADEYLQYHNIEIASIENAVFASLHQDFEQPPEIEEQIRKAIEAIDSYADRKNPNIARDFKSEVNEQSFSFGRPWGTAIRQRLATAVNLKKEVDSLWTLGLNSLANSDHVNLGNHFIELLKKDPAIRIVVREVESKIIRDIKQRTYKVPYLTAQKLDNTNFSGCTGSLEFGGSRHTDSMFKQLQTTILNPFKSATKYSATWQVGMNDLTWSIRHASVQYRGVYHAVYNAAGFVFVWEMEFTIDDVLDLRPRSGKKNDFGGRNVGEKAYNTVTSILGTAYHDIAGNTDKLKVHARWKDHGNGENKIHPW